MVWFGEALDPDVLDRAEAAADCDVFLTIGTSSVVYPAASFVDQARRSGAFTVEINPEATPASASPTWSCADRRRRYYPRLKR